ncbi:MAG: hypothetical protein O7B30_02370 [Thaumarchaeota archaeon]|nr:hypothetical protein [Nitrososphaerota archaeon]
MSRPRAGTKDVSGFQVKKDRILEFIAFTGPTTIYRAHVRTSMPLGTTQRVFKALVEGQEIIKYRVEKHVSGNTKKYYGLTETGLLTLLAPKKSHVKDSFDKVARIWFKESKFSVMSKEISTRLDDGETIEALKHFYVISADALHLPQYSDKLDYEVKLLLGLQLILAKQPEEISKWLGILYHRLPSVKKAVDAYIEGVNRFQRSL